MRIVGVHNLKSGMVLGRPVYSASHNEMALLKAEVQLTEAAISKLRELEIPWVYIEDELSSDVEMENAIDDETRVRTVHTLKAAMADIRPRKFDRQNKSLIPMESFRKVNDCVADIIENMSKNRNALLSMINVMGTDMEIYSHLVNVAVLAILVALEMDMPRGKVHEIGMGALLHDIGKTEVDINIIRKKHQGLNPKEEENLKLHPAIGYTMVKDDTSISAIVKTIILMHHENIDGTGYPLGLSSDQINIYARIVSACNMLDNLLNTIENGHTLPVYKALEILSSNCILKIDSEVYKCLVSKIAPYPPGTGVILNTGEKALVTVNNTNMPSRPIVKVIRDENGNFCSRLKVIDMTMDLTVFIEGTCEI